MSMDYPILWWTAPPSDPMMKQEYPLVLGDCGFEYTCTFFESRELLDKAKVVLFDRSTTNPSDMPTSERDVSQAWILNNVHDPEVTLNEITTTTNLVKIPFTHLWSYTFESDIVETYFQPSSSGLSEKTSDMMFFESGAFLDMVTSPPMIDLAEKNKLRALGKNQGGKAPIAWIVENHATNEQNVKGDCKDSPSGRESYVKELLKLVDIDIYGSSCLENTPWPIQEDSQKPLLPQEIMKDYKFVLALERINCKDYVTSSLADALVVGAIPIVDGPKDYTQFSPTDNALIQISSFIAPELLAQEIDSLDKDDTKYLGRMDYKKHYTLEAGSITQKELLPLFNQAFGKPIGYPIANTNSTMKSGVADVLGPDRRGAYCGICRLAHDISEGTLDWTANNKSFSLPSKEGECESVPRYTQGLPAQMEAYDQYLNIGSSHNNSLDITITFDDVGFDPKGPTTNPTTDPNPNLDTWNQSGGLEGNLSSSAAISTHKSPPPYEIYYLLMLIAILVIGVGVLAFVTTKNTRKLKMWPWQHLFYNRIPDEDQEAQSLERVMLREMGEDLVYQ
ncbi:Alpha 1,3 fucosyltransferase [Entomortierella beljakovae]|nr:Alpha 1,3 fucosyltransferase [Entomortierella beljakovae]